MSILSMTKTLLKSLLHGPYTVLYPLRKKDLFPNTRGRIEIDIAACIFCGICEKRCPTGALAVNKEARSWTIERMKCIQCNYCTEVCPKKCLRMDGQYAAPSTGSAGEEYIARVPDNTADN